LTKRLERRARLAPCLYAMHLERFSQPASSAKGTNVWAHFCPAPCSARAIRDLSPWPVEGLFLARAIVGAHQSVAGGPAPHRRRRRSLFPPLSGPQSPAGPSNAPQYPFSTGCKTALNVLFLESRLASNSAAEADFCALYQQLLDGWNKGSGTEFAAPSAEDGDLIG
jgi:hypothetical protein